MVTKLEERILARVVAARKRAGLDRGDVAKALNLELPSYGHYERGRYAFTIEQLFQLSRILSVPVEELLGLPTELTKEEQRAVALFRRIHNPNSVALALSMLEGFAKMEENAEEEGT